MLFVDEGVGRPLPVTDEIGVDESGNGYALRMLDRNGLTFAELAELVSSMGHRYLPHAAAPYVAFMFGAKVQAVRRAIPDVVRHAGRTQIRFMGHVFARPYLVRHTRPQLCPLCVLTGGYVKAAWELSLATACTVHEVQLVDVCSACDRRISWRRPSLTTCWCGEEFASFLPKGADAGELWFNRCLEDKLAASPSDSGRSDATFPSLGALGLDCLMRLVRSLGIGSVLAGGKAVPGKVTRTLSTSEMRAVVLHGLDCCSGASAHTSERLEQVWDLPGLLQDVDGADWRRLNLLFNLACVADRGKSAIYDPQLSLDFEVANHDS